MDVLWIQFGMNLEAGGGGGTCDEVDDGFETSQGLATPVLADVREKPMLDFVPLAGQELSGLPRFAGVATRRAGRVARFAKSCF